MKIKYNGPQEKVAVPPHGAHERGEIRDYPDDFARKLLESSRKQQFEVVGADDPGKRNAKKPLRKMAKKKGGPEDEKINND